MPATTQETGVKTPKSKPPEAETRRSERVKQAESGAYALPPPLQVTERQATKAAEKAAEKAAKATAKAAAKAAAMTAATTASVTASTPQKASVSVEEAQLDLDIDIMEKSILDTERKLKDLVDEKRVQNKREKLERLKEKLDRSQKKVEEAEIGEKKSEILVSDLRKDNKLKKKAQNTLADLGLFSDSDQSASDSSVSSDSSDILNFTEPRKTHKAHKSKKRSSSPSSSSDSSDDSDSSHKHKSHNKKHKKKSKKSGMSKKASDRVKYPQIWPHSVLQFEFVSQNIQFKDISFKMFVAGELEILTSKISKREFKGRIKLLKKIAYLSNVYDWKRLLQFYAAWVRRIEMGLNSWHDDSSVIENAMLMSKSFSLKQGRDVLKSEQVLWCPDYNNNRCSVHFC